MLFYVYIDPLTISEAGNNGNAEVQLLLNALKGFRINCAIITFEDYHQIEEFNESVKNLPDCFERKLIKTIFKYFNNYKRFIQSLRKDYTSPNTDIEFLRDQENIEDVDYILLSKENSERYNGSREHSSLSQYNSTLFEQHRSEIAAFGKTFNSDDRIASDFFNENFKKVFKHSICFEFCDYSLGRNYGDNYEHSLKLFFRWLGSFLTEPSNKEICFHLDLPSNSMDQYILSQINGFLPPQLQGLKLTFKFYQNSARHISLPHQRYLISDQIALEIGRGVDFIDRNSGKNRDTSFSYKDYDQIRASINGYAPYLTRTLTNYTI